MIKAIPLELKEAQDYINTYHRHHKAPHRDKFRIGAEINGELVGVIMVGRPIARRLDDGKTLEVLRLCNNGEKDICSFLYSRVARIGKEMGYKKMITYILDSENGTSLKASGWHCEASNVGGKNWSVPSRPREFQSSQYVFNLDGEITEEKTKYPIDTPKQRWVKELG